MARELDATLHSLLVSVLIRRHGEVDVQALCSKVRGFTARWRVRVALPRDVFFQRRRGDAPKLDAGQESCQDTAVDTIRGPCFRLCRHARQRPPHQNTLGGAGSADNVSHGMAGAGHNGQALHRNDSLCKITLLLDQEHEPRRGRQANCSATTRSLRTRALPCFHSHRRWNGRKKKGFSSCEKREAHQIVCVIALSPWGRLSVVPPEPASQAGWYGVTQLRGPISVDTTRALPRGCSARSSHPCAHCLTLPPFLRSLSSRFHYPRIFPSSFSFPFVFLAGRNKRSLVDHFHLEKFCSLSRARACALDRCPSPVGGHAAEWLAKGVWRRALAAMVSVGGSSSGDGPDGEALLTMEKFLDSPKAQPHLRSATCSGLRKAGVDVSLPNELKTVLAPSIHNLPRGNMNFSVLPQHNRKGTSMPSSVHWYQSPIVSPEPLKAHQRRPKQTAFKRNDFAGTAAMKLAITQTMMDSPADGQAAGVGGDPGPLRRLEARKTPLQGPKGLHNLANGSKQLPRSNGMLLSITSDPRIAPEDELAEPDSRFPAADDAFRIVGHRENLRFNRTLPVKYVSGATRAVGSTVTSTEETLRGGDMYPFTMTDRAGGPDRILPPDATFSLLSQSLPQGMLKEDRRIFHSMAECIKHAENPPTSRTARQESKKNALEEYVARGRESYETSKAGMRGLIKKSRLGHGNPTTWTTPRFTIGKEQIPVQPIPIPEENLRLRTAGPCRRRSLDPNKPPDTVSCPIPLMLLTCPADLAQHNRRQVKGGEEQDLPHLAGCRTLVSWRGRPTWTTPWTTRKACW